MKEVGSTQLSGGIFDKKETHTWMDDPSIAHTKMIPPTHPHLDG